MRRDGKCEAHIHAARVVLDGRVEKRFHLRKGDNLVKFSPDLGAEHAEDGPIEKDVFAAGKLGMKTRAHLEEARNPPAQIAPPFVGSVIRLRIFSNVDLPAPFRPMMPSTSPRLTSKLTSLSAQNSLTSSPCTICRPRAKSTPCAQNSGLAADHVAQRGFTIALPRLVSHQITF